MSGFSLVNGFKEGDCVVYIPSHADNDLNHEDCEHGVVERVTEKFVFVRYEGWVNAKATIAKDLVGVRS